MKRAYVIVDLGFGDSGKGSWTDAIASKVGAHTVIRYNGGAQAAHNVWTPDGQHHVFAQFGSGTLVGARTFLSKYMLIDPPAMVNEAEALGEKIGSIADVWLNTTISKHALVITPFQRAVNRIREALRFSRHGSCGRGIGETVHDSIERPDCSIRMGDLLDPIMLSDKLTALQAYSLEKAENLIGSLRVVGARVPDAEWLTSPSAVMILRDLYQSFPGLYRLVDDDEMLNEIYAQDRPIVFEGAQGVLLDQDYGFHPHTTWSKTTTEYADRMLHGSGFEVTKIGVIRSYMTRHGAGPLLTETDELDIPGEDNKTDAWQESFRVGWMDLVMLQYALDIQGKVDRLVVSCMDHIKTDANVNVCIAYKNAIGQEFDYLKPTGRAADNENLTKELLDLAPIYIKLRKNELLPTLAARFGIPIFGYSEGKTRHDKRFL